jgi:hypothetical protein
MNRLHDRIVGDSATAVLWGLHWIVLIEHFSQSRDFFVDAVQDRFSGCVNFRSIFKQLIFVLVFNRFLIKFSFSRWLLFGQLDF